MSLDVNIVVHSQCPICVQDVTQFFHYWSWESYSMEYLELNARVYISTIEFYLYPNQCCQMYDKSRICTICYTVCTIEVAIVYK